MALSGNMTEAEADTLLELIGRTGTGEHTEEGVSFRTVQALYAGIRGHSPRERPRRYAVSHHGHCRTGD
jgi:hypothetical protein